VTSIYRVPEHLVEDLWPSISGYVALAMRHHPFLEAEDVLTLLLEWRQATLFLATDARGVLGFAVVEVVEYPRCRVANVVAAGGRKGILPVLVGPMREEINAWARERDAWVFTAMGRPGWIRIAERERGNALLLSMIWKEIPDGRRRQEADHDRDARPLGSGSALPH
jgi:hypothetical protein